MFILLIIALVLAFSEAVYGVFKRSMALFLVGAVFAILLGAALALYAKYADTVYLDGASRMARIIMKEMII